MKIENGKIVKFFQSFMTPTTGYYGQFVRELQYPEGLDDAIAEWMVNQEEKATATIPYTGFDHIVYDESLIFTVPRENFKGVSDLKVGMVFRNRQALNNSHYFVGVVKNIEEKFVRIDCNHPSIGQKNIESTITILTVRNPSESEEQLGFKPTIAVYE